MADLSGLRKTPFFDDHVAAGARIVPFAGWAMPVQYVGLMAEHKAVRSGVGLFDVSHMGELLVEGDGAEAFLQRMTTNDVGALDVGQAQYTLALTPSGGIVDDLLVYKRGPGRYLVCINAGRRAEDWAWFSEHHDEAADGCTLVNASDDFAQLAIQGRLAEAVVQPLTDLPLGSLGAYRFGEAIVAGVQCVVARTGYTGEDGFELFFEVSAAATIWSALRESGEPHGMAPVGLGARDTLRLEAKFCLYGNDIDETTNPLEARLKWVTKLDKGDFIGRDALVAIRDGGGVSRLLCGFELSERGIARHGMPVYVDGQSFGVVTSGTMSPSLGTAIGLCYLPRTHCKPGATIEVEIRNRRVPALVVKTPFYKRPY